MALVEYELQRLQRIAENRRRMEDMGIFTVRSISAYPCVEYSFMRNVHICWFRRMEMSGLMSVMHYFVTQ